MNNPNPDPKGNRIIAETELPWCGKCHGGFSKHHAEGCPSASPEDMLVWLERQRKENKSIRKHAFHWLNEVRKMHGKLAMLKRENNILRCRLDRIKNENPEK